MYLAHDREQSLAVLNIIMKFPVPLSAENVCIGWGIPDFSRTVVFVVTKKLLKRFKEFPQDSLLLKFILCLALSFWMEDGFILQWIRNSRVVKKCYNNILLLRYNPINELKLKFERNVPSYSILQNNANLNLLISFNELTTELKEPTLFSVMNDSQLDRYRTCKFPETNPTLKCKSIY
jgi:hypothetical protein